MNALSPLETAPDAPPAFTPSIDMIMQLQAELAKMPQAIPILRHHFSNHVYARELTIPAGVVAVGKMHGTEHLFIMIRGDMQVMTHEGMRRLTGYHVLNSLPGIKRVVYCYEETTVLTIHVTDKTDPEEIEADCIIPDPVPAIDQECTP